MGFIRYKVETIVITGGHLKVLLLRLPPQNFWFNWPGWGLGTF